MAAFDFPASPSNGDTYSLNNVSYTYNGTVWKKTSAGITDGDKGDITVSNSGQTFTVDDDAVTYSKIQNVSTTNRILGRDSAGAGVIEEITPANLRTMINVADGAEVNVQADWSSSSGDSQILNKPTIPSNIGDLSNVSSSTPSTNQVLKWDGSAWSPAADSTSSGGGGDVNQNAFSNVAVSGQDTVAADSTTDTLNIAAGSNVTITTNASNDTVTIASTDTNTTYSVGDGGLTQNNFTDALKTKLDGIETSADVTDATNVAAAGALMDGDFTSNGFLKRTGAGSYTVDTNTYLTSVPSGYLQNLSEDTTPQLGGDLDMNSNFISSGILGIKNTGSQSEIRLYCESSNAHYASLKAPAHADFSGDITFTLPSGYGSNGEVLQSNGSGGTSWVAQTTAYTNSSVDSHLNTSSASSGQILSWNGSDYAWVADQTGGGGGGGLVGSNNEELFVEAENQIDNSFSTTTNKNYISASPLVVASGVTLTIVSGSTMAFV